MKKIYSLFILSILALTMFIGCQMPTDGTVNELAAEEETTQTETTDTFNVSVVSVCVVSSSAASSFTVPSVGI